MNRDMILTILILVAEYGIPAVMKAVANMKKDEITMQDLVELEIKNDPFEG